MKWILIGLKSDSENISFMKDFFSEKKKIELEEFIVDGDKFSVDLKKISSAFVDSTYCIFFSADKISDNKNLLFLYGCVSSSKVTTFFLGEEKSVCFGRKSSELPEYFHCFSDFKKLSIEIEKELPIFEHDDLRLCSYKELFNKGLPFTADSFAHAISKEKTDICNLYIDAGMDINSVDSNGTPLLNIAVRNDCDDMVNWILTHDVDIDAVSEDRGYTAVMDAVWRKNFKLTECLIEHGANLDHISKEGQSILVLAVGNGDARICEILLKNGADSETKDAMGMSARGYANLFNNKSIVEVFEKYPVKK